jgi:hypothetical protein
MGWITIHWTYQRELASLVFLANLADEEDEDKVHDDREESCTSKWRGIQKKNKVRINALIFDG